MCVCVCVCIYIYAALCLVTQVVSNLCNLMDCSRPGSLVHEIFRQEYWSTICKIDSQWELAVCLRKLRQRLCISVEGWDGERDGREVQKGGDICIPMAGSSWGLTENSKILQSNYPSIKNNLKKRIWEQAATSSSMGSSQPRNQTHISICMYVYTHTHIYHVYNIIYVCNWITLLYTWKDIVNQLYFNF